MKRNRHYQHADGLLWSALRLAFLVALGAGALILAAHIASGL